MQIEGNWAHLTDEQQAISGYETPFPIRRINIPVLKEVILDVYEETEALKAQLVQHPASVTADDRQQLNEGQSLLEYGPHAVDLMEAALIERFGTCDPNILEELPLN